MGDGTLGEVSGDPDREAALHIKVLEGLSQADLNPLADLLRSEISLGGALASFVADAIEGKSDLCRITARRMRAGRPTTADPETALRNGTIALFVEQRHATSQKKAAVYDAIERFGLGRTGITDAIRANSTYRANLPERVRSFFDERVKEALAREVARTGA